MADNVEITAGTGTSIATDDIGGVQYQRIKVTWGPDGTANDTDVASGKPFPIQHRVSDGTAWTYGAGSVGTGTPRVTLGSDDPAVAVLGATGDAASASTTIKAALRAIATALGTTALDLGIGTGGTRTIRAAFDTAQLAPLSSSAQAMSAGYQLVALATDSPGIKADDAAFTPGTSSVYVIGLQADESSTDSVDEGDAGAPRMTLDRKVITTPQPHTAGGLSIFRSLDLDETEEDIKTSAGQLYKLRITNFATNPRYVKLYNATAANVTVGSTTPVDTIPVPAGSSTAPTVITETYGAFGVTFDTAISAAATTGLADNDTGAPSANDVVVTAYYK